MSQFIATGEGTTFAPDEVGATTSPGAYQSGKLYVSREAEDLSPSQQKGYRNGGTSGYEGFQAGVNGSPDFKLNETPQNETSSIPPQAQAEQGVSHEVGLTSPSAHPDYGASPGGDIMKSSASPGGQNLPDTVATPGRPSKFGGVPEGYEASVDRLLQAKIALRRANKRKEQADNDAQQRAEDLNFYTRYCALVQERDRKFPEALTICGCSRRNQRQRQTIGNRKQKAY